MRTHLISLILFFISTIAYSQDAPVLICADVDLDGNVSLHWLHPEQASGLIRYEVYHQDGAFVKIADVSSDSTHYLHLGAQADLQSQSYYIDAVYGGSNESSSVINTIFLQVAVSADFNQATLYWNPLSTPSPDGSDLTYRIYMDNPIDHSWHSIGLADGESFEYNVHVCNEWLNFRVELQNSHECSSWSNVSGGQFKDVIKPAKPVFDSVSINYFYDGPHIVLGWEASTSRDVAGYVLYRHEGSNFAFDTVYGIDNTFAIDLAVDACDTIYKYTIASMDSCGNVSPLTDPLQNIHLIDVVYNPCLLQATITYEDFVDLDAEWLRFDLIRNSSIGESSNTESFVQPLTNQNNEFRETAKTVTIINGDLKVGRTYDYFIRGTFSKNGNIYTTSSCIKSIFAYGYQKPFYSYLANADVLPDNQIELTIDYDTIIINSSLTIWRSEPGEEFLNYIRTVDVDTISAWPLKLVDTSADGSRGFYYYKVKVMDSCGHKWIESNQVKTIGLKAAIEDRDHNRLEWNLFKGWNQGVDQYYIYRMENNVEPDGPIDSVWRGATEYVDDISPLAGSVESFIYWVQAVEQRVNDHGFKEKSNSNRAVISPESDIYFPNAFKPGGTDVFKPIFRFLGGTNYVFQIYNRWGQLIYETTDKQAGWDGTYKGTYVEQGVYIYKFQYMDVYGNSFNKQGTVTVIY